MAIEWKNYKGNPQGIVPTTAAGVEIPFPAALGANGGLKVEGVASGVAVPVSLAALPVPAVRTPIYDSATGAAASPGVASPAMFRSDCVPNKLFRAFSISAA